MIWLLISYLLISFDNVVLKWVIHDEHSFYVTSRRAIFTFLLTFAAVWFFLPGGFSFINQPMFYLIIISCLLGAMGLIFMVSFLKNGSLVRLGYYFLLGVALNGAYTFIFNDIPVTVKLIIGSSILLIGYLLFLWDESRKIKLEPILISQHLLLLGMTVCFSGDTLIQWKILKSFHPLSIMVTQELTVLIISTILYLFVKKKTVKTTFLSYLRFPVLAIIIMLAVFTGLLGLKTTNPFVSSIGGVLISLLTVLFGSIFFKEKLSWIQMASFAVIMVGEILFFV